MALPSAIDAIARAGHVLSAVLWVGFTVFMAFVRPRAMAGLSESATREFMPRLAKTIVPWMMGSAVSTWIFGFIVYWDLGDRVGYGDLGMTLNAGVLLAAVMFILGLAFVMPTGRKMGKVLEGGAPPSMAEIRRLGMVTRVNAVLGITIVVLMVLHGRLGV